MGIISNIFSSIFWACEFYFIFSHTFLGNFLNKIGHNFFPTLLNWAIKVFSSLHEKNAALHHFKFLRKFYPKTICPIHAVQPLMCYRFPRICINIAKVRFSSLQPNGYAKLPLFSAGWRTRQKATLSWWQWSI